MNAADSKHQKPVRHYVLRLFVSGATRRSTLAIENIRKICDTELQGHYTLEVIDIYQQPELTKRYQIIAVPTLIKSLPAPIRVLIGDLTQKEKVLVGLNLNSKGDQA
ncbi:MAG TPA: circadian clock KaiB family protein [Gallionella sp.]|nr:circadian clock KaiB family protein [Gallionella sp.]